MINPTIEKGDEIVLIHMKGESGMPPGTKGVVTNVVSDPFEDDGLIISVEWENKRTLSLVTSEDLWMKENPSEAINEIYSDLGELTFKKMWYSPEAADSIYFGDFDKDIDTISSSYKIRLLDDKTDDIYYFEPGIIKPTNNKKFLRVRMRDFEKSYKQSAEKLREKEDDKKSSNLNVADLKKKTSGVPDTILKALKDVYPNNWGRINEPNCETLDGVIDIFPAILGERWSILNFFDTNPGVIKLLLEKYSGESTIQTLEGFKEWIIDNKESLFGENSEFLLSLINKNLQSFERGWELESNVIDIIKRNNPSLKNENITQYCLGSIKDRVSSIDVTINGKGYQIKPSTKMERQKNGSIKVYTFQMRDWYKNKKRDGLDYIIYSNGKNIAVFPNENYWVSKDGKTAVHYTNIIKNPFSDSIMEQTKKDLINKIEDSDIEVSLLDDLITQLTDEDITDLFLRNLDRKFLKGGDKQTNIRNYLVKYIKSLGQRVDKMEQNDDFNVDDEFLYGGIESEKSKIEKKINEAHWTEWQKILPVLGKENKYLFDFFEELRKSGIINMLESTHFVYSGSDHIKRYIQYLKNDKYNEDDYEELFKAADLAKDAMIRLSMIYLEQEGKDLSIDNINRALRNLAGMALKSFIMLK